MKMKIIQVKDIEVLVYKKNIKNLHLSVLPPNGQARVSVPKGVSDDVIRTFIIKKYHWIKKHVRSFQEQKRQTKREYVSGESHYFKGRRYILKTNYTNKPKIEIRNKKHIYFCVPEHYTLRQRQNYYEKWLRNELKKKKMKTKWGSCNHDAKRIWINLELIKKPREYLEYVIVHELVHLLEKNHSKRFKELMDKYLPKWRTYKRQLNEFIL